MEASERAEGIEIRPARRAELAKIIELLAQDSRTQPPEDGAAVPGHFAAFDVIAADPNHDLIVATLDEEVVGTLQITFIPGLAFGGAWRAQVEGVRVRQDVRNLGIGRRLMEWVIERAKERGCRLIQLTSNRSRTEAQRFYARLGFEASHVGMKLYL